MRLDLYLTTNKHFSTRQKAKYAIEDGFILVNGRTITKCGYNVEENDTISVVEREENFVSRGGYKLSKAIKTFKFDIFDKICLDIGQSTGGFTDCLLKHGAKFIYGIEVGYDQIHESLKGDNRIKTLEKTNFKELKKDMVNNTMFDIVSIDVSFISLSKIWPNLTNFVDKHSVIIALIKPQFELYYESNKHKGAISSKIDHKKAIESVISSANVCGFYIHNLTYSPILGEKKENIEYLGLFSLSGDNSQINIDEIINQAHMNLK